MSKNAKPVEMVNRYGKVISRFNSITEATKISGYSTGQIQNSIKKERFINGYKFRRHELQGYRYTFLNPQLDHEARGKTIDQVKEHSATLQREIREIERITNEFPGDVRDQRYLAKIRDIKSGIILLLNWK